MTKTVRAKYENGVLKLLELDHRESEEARIIALPREFPELVEEVEIEARGDIGDVLREGRERRTRWYSIQALS